MRNTEKEGGVDLLWALESRSDLIGAVSPAWVHLRRLCFKTTSLMQYKLH